MATDDVNIAEDADMAECDGDKVVTMMDVLQEQQDFEEDANAVLGASDDKNCTYSKGYIKRQALYACLTCCTEAKVDPTKRAGVCLACSLTCHENHELIELYTKRNFRCDCGNAKFNTHPCQFTPDKTDLNDDNVYNQNFSGLYCTCQRPYPDPDSTIEDDDMIQCIICEDWLHASHLEAVVPANDQYSEMVCKNCMEKNEFLHDYSMFAVTVEIGDVDIISVNGDAKSADTSLCNGDPEEKLVNGIEHENDTTSVTVNRDAKMDEDKEKSIDKKTDDESTNAEIGEEIKQDDSSTVEPSELKPEEKEKSNTDDGNMDLDTESKMAEQEESTNAEINEETKQDESSTIEPSELKPEEKEKSNTDDSNMDLDTESKMAEQEESTNAEISEETKQDESSTVEPSELKPEEKEKSNTDDSNMDLDTESKMAEQEEQSAETKTNESDKTDAPENSNNDKEHKETIEDASYKSDDKPDAAENTPTADPDQHNKTSPEKIESTEEKEPTKADETKEQTETKEQIKQSISDENGDADNPQENKTDTSEQTEEQLLDDLTSMSADLTSKEKTDKATEEKLVESMEQSDKNKEKDEVETNKEEPRQETVNDSEDKSEEKPVVENEIETGNIEVPDTSQPEKGTKEKADSVMDAIDELLQTANAAKEKEEEIKESTTVSTESKETIAVKTKDSDVDMSANENVLDNVPEDTEDTTDSNDKTIINTEDIEMSETTTQNEHAGESKDEPKVNENKFENESVDAEDKSRVTDAANESINQENVALNENDNNLKTLNETDSELKTSDNDSTVKTKPKDGNEVFNVAENAKEHKRKLSIDLTDDISSKKAKLQCVRPKEVKKIHKGATFWPSNFRQKLCTCGECLSMYKDLKVLFLTDLDDTVFAYESLGKENVAGGASQYEKGMQALSSLDRIHQINALTEYNRMRDKLLDFLKSFKDRKEIVKEEDIKAFFAEMKPRREPDGVYFCR